MTRLETRYPCPICLAVKMEKVRIEVTSPVGAPRGPRELVLDHCARCGGVWFDAGEVQLLRGVDAERLWRRIVKRDGVHAMSCHSCRALLPRTEEVCGSCGWRVVLDCPICGEPMRTSEQSGMRLDWCPRDRGVWFDHDELTGVWKLEAQAVARRRGAGGIEEGGLLLLDVLSDPFVMYHGVSAAAHVGSAAVETLASAEAIGQVASAVGEVTASIFEVIVEIIGGLFG